MVEAMPKLEKRECLFFWVRHAERVDHKVNQEALLNPDRPKEKESYPFKYDSPITENGIL